mgnify:CR=1 FL=1
MAEKHERGAHDMRNKPRRKGSQCPFCNHFTRGDLYGNGALKRLGIHIRTDHADKMRGLGGTR